MRKSNWIVLAVLVVLSAFLLWMWYFFGFNVIDDPLDLVLSIVWWVVVIVAVLAIRAAEKKRQERVRTAFVAQNYLYNSEEGLVALGAGASPVDVLQGILARLKYNFNIADFPEKSQMTFDYVVHTKKFEIKSVEEGRDQTAGAQPARTQPANQVSVQAVPTSYEQVAEWEGEVLVVARPDDDPLPFANREELLRILESVPLSTTGSGMSMGGTAPIGA